MIQIWNNITDNYQLPKNAIEQRVRDYNKKNPKEIFDEAMKIMKKIENCEVEEKDLEEEEAEMVLLLASIQDYVRERIKEKTPDYSKDINSLER